MHKLSGYGCYVDPRAQRMFGRYYGESLQIIREYHQNLKWLLARANNRCDKGFAEFKNLKFGRYLQERVDLREERVERVGKGAAGIVFKTKTLGTRNGKQVEIALKISRPGDSLPAVVTRNSLLTPSERCAKYFAKQPRPQKGKTKLHRYFHPPPP
ncbi:hypothetical protein M427DRAFT_220066 [Gonapodya prolifera JEL478]|uniref:Protein kinase domain-containing protein n=1 Tax=Gonapodya prolifera (strain JEL478) TaxID=1344416 RepID=A0A138ZZL1_GONPJ|nr:hypothetical protein M427DRAFT_220066 [Gonapodya prolifera JEL478]|eukprot:KXS09573.1 hypothetical protein M427DRAFT_220066 [Gonapodya prolifera JEL478]